MKIKSSLKSIRAKCLDCSAWSKQEVRLCSVKDCVLYPYRMGKNPNYKFGYQTGNSERTKYKPPVKTIRAKCLDCCIGSNNEVKLCPVENCALYPYRFGKNPNYKSQNRRGNPEALKKYRESR